MSERAFQAGVAVLLLCLTLQCHGGGKSELVLNDFEGAAELDKLEWKCRTLYSLSDKHATHGSQSLRMELFPSDYPGLVPILKGNDWRGYKHLSFDVYNPQEKTVQISVRIDDRKENPDYGSRYNRSFALGPGMNHLSIPLDSLVTSGNARPLDLKKIRRLLIFMDHPPEKTTLYVDYIRLTPAI